ncbi:MAG: tripartite tricarboxylate transporter substrate binding protein [Alphaproteobacteria bacterium]|nr:tripartite tricarboxylate transporter substrate binding protein [Alphaproteobacteria bacterium]
MFFRQSIGIIGAASVLALVAVTHAAAQGDQYPSKPIRILVGSVPGGTPDLIGRTIGEKFQAYLGQPGVAENRPGAGGALAAELVAKSPPDGYTVVIGISTVLASTPALYRNAPFDPLTSFAPVAGTAIQDFLLVVNPAVKAQNLREFIALAKAEPGKINYASAGNSSPHHLGMELLKRAAGIDIVHVPYRGAPAAVPDLLSGQISAMLISYVIAKPHLAAGKMRALGMTSPERRAEAPEIPTVIEGGVPGYTHNTWIAVLAAAGTPAPIVAKLGAAIDAIIALPDVKTRFAALGLDPWSKKPDEILATIRSEVAVYTKLIQDAGIRVD